MSAGVASELRSREVSHTGPTFVAGPARKAQNSVVHIVVRVTLPVLLVECAREVDENVTDRCSIDEPLQLLGRVGWWLRDGHRRSLSRGFDGHLQLDRCLAGAARQVTTSTEDRSSCRAPYPTGGGQAGETRGQQMMSRWRCRVPLRCPAPERVQGIAANVSS